MQPIKPKSVRAQKSRIAKIFRKNPLLFVLQLIFWFSILGGFLLLISGSAWGYSVFSLACASLMLTLWNKGELSQLRKHLGTGSIDGLLDPEILANIKSDNSSAYDVWTAMQKTEAHYFFQNRFMLHPSLFEQFLSKEPGSAAAVWEKTEVLRNSHGQKDYPACIVLVALVKSIPNVDQLLRQAKLELEEIESGISWYLAIEKKRELARQKHYFGGWGRDLAFGYTPILNRIGHSISSEVQTYGFFQDTEVHDQVVEQMVGAMGSGNSGLALVGEVGTGKTTCVYAFAQHLLERKDLPKSIRHHQVIALDAPTLVSQARNRGELEGLIINTLNEAIKAKNIILFFDDAHAFFSEGTGSVDLSKVLQPVLESGGVQTIFAMTPKELQQLKTNNGNIAGRLQVLQVPPTDEKQTIHVLRDKILAIEYKHKVLFTQQALNEAYRLGGRYVDTQAMPGAALNVLETASPLAKDGYVTPEVVELSIESSVGVKLQHAGQDESTKLLNLEDELHKYVINQKQAVRVIADALRRSRSGVGNPERPVGTFLFLGPTGVGKTELSKALARVYFGSESAIVRVDMNQFVQPEDVDRLITPMLGEQLGFLGQVRKQPFSVILLDEIEKAHPNVINLLLQMLDEGVMKDVDNKPVSFKDAIIIATSNAGADKIRQMIGEGQDIVAAQEKLVDYIIEAKAFAPEFVNRFDEVVVFRPLTQDELVQVIDLIIGHINKTLDDKKVQVQLSDSAKRWLVEKGYDSRLGARPMRRVAQRYVENILARKLLQKDAASGSTVQLGVADFENLDNNS